MDEVAFAQEISIAVANYNGKLHGIDFEKGIFKVSCPVKNKVELAFVLGNIMKKYEEIETEWDYE